MDFLCFFEGLTYLLRKEREREEETERVKERCGGRVLGNVNYNNFLSDVCPTKTNIDDIIYMWNLIKMIEVNLFTK